MSSATLLPNGEQQFCDGAGVPYSSGLVYLYTPGTTDFKDSYQNEAGTILNENPVPLDSAGRAVIFGIGDYRQILVDQDANQIWDQIVTGALAADAISTAMAPICAAATTEQAVELLGIPELIQTAVENIQLMSGPTGPQGASVIGPTGPSGPTGPTGPAGGGGSSTTGGVQAGSVTSDGAGLVTVTYPVPFTSSVVYISVQVPIGTGLIGSQNVISSLATGFVAYVYDLDGFPVVSTPLNYYAIGF